ncbi:MAG: hypothetical protein KA953_03685 [Lachnospiraceae bacterium]|nr:hypothetical protein [Lachnospiraceae bacterium]
MKKESEVFRASLEKVQLPILILDKKWHQLFQMIGKSQDIKDAEEQVNHLLKEQGRLTQDIKEFKKIKSNLMDEIVANMDQLEEKRADDKRTLIDDNQRLIEEVNRKLDEASDALLDIPNLLKEENEKLMVYCMDYCYDLLKANGEKIEEIGNWIKKIRLELKKNILLKQDAEIKNQEIYNYMHAFLGAKVINVFDLKFDEDGTVLDEQE